MSTAYYITLYEFGFAFLIMFLMLIHKAFLDRDQVHQKDEIKQLKTWLRPFISGERAINDETAQQLTYPISILVSALEDYDASFEDDNWQHIKMQLLKTRALKWAKKHSRSPFWSKRNLAVRIFLLLPLQEDLDVLTRLLDDKDFYIRMLACEAIGKLDLVESIDLLIKQMSKELYSARFMYRHVLNKMPYEYLPQILKTYEEADNDEIRICCLDLLTHRFYGNVYSFLHASLKSENPTIRKMIATILANIHTLEAIEDLIELIRDPKPEVRQAALTSLGKVQEDSAFDAISDALNDDDYNVRLEAALSLYQYGQKGVSVLELQDSDINPRAHEVARFVLTLP